MGKGHAIDADDHVARRLRIASMTLDGFNFAFTLFGLVLGLALAEVLNGPVRIVRSTTPVKIGWATPLLALIVALDLISFWLGAWEDRALIAINFRTLVFGTILAGIYYCAANLVFPADLAESPDLDHWFAQQKRTVAAGILTANLLFSAGEIIMLGTWSVSMVGRVNQVAYLSLAALLIIVRPGWRSITVMTLMMGIFAVLMFRA